MRLLLPVLLCSLPCALAAPALASSPHSLYVVPSRVELRPADKEAREATEASIHGVFVTWDKSAPRGYTEPVCGVVHVRCPAGKEKECRQQWAEIAEGVGKATCVGFGQMAKLPTVRVRPVGTPAGEPDPYDLGMGTGEAWSLGGKCPKMKELAKQGCPEPAPTPTPVQAPATKAPAKPSK